ncbi:MAG: carbohydrate ABC transporter permease [Thermomicrobia bacterium]|nr:carbohydrate ABC transporter permease [Thermomicrobia bacterium]MCA1723266.1 carbohydrate ABC transporter permease [Thermomicrobia bacterium]
MQNAEEVLSRGEATVTEMHAAVVAGRKNGIGQIFSYVFLIVVAFLTFLPFFLMISISFKTRAQFAVQPIWPTFPLHFSNYRFAWEQVFRPVVNTIIVCVASIGGTLFVASLAAYAFARFKFPGSRVLFLGIISLLMVPDVLLLVPRYVVTAQLHLLGNYLGLIVPYISFGSIFAIFVLRTFFASVPGELIEAARMDGASHVMIFWRIMIPLSRPILATLAIIQLIRVWNDFIWPFVVISKKSQYTLALILKTFSSDFGTQWGLIMACYVMASLPLLLVFAVASKQFIKGLTSGAIKF